MVSIVLDTGDITVDKADQVLAPRKKINRGRGSNASRIECCNFKWSDWFHPEKMTFKQKLEDGEGVSILGRRSKFKDLRCDVLGTVHVLRVYQKSQ